MAAQIHRYNKPDLYGTTLIKPFNATYQWIARVIDQPCPEEIGLLTECAIRVVRIVIAILVLAITALPALIGRLLQIIHKHTLPKEACTKSEQLQMASLLDGTQVPSSALNETLIRLLRLDTANFLHLVCKCKDPNYKLVSPFKEILLDSQLVNLDETVPELVKKIVLLMVELKEIKLLGDSDDAVYIKILNPKAADFFSSIRDAITNA